MIVSPLPPQPSPRQQKRTQVLLRKSQNVFKPWKPVLVRGYRCSDTDVCIAIQPTMVGNYMHRSYASASQAVMTVDNYLHIFDLPASKTITTTTPIEEVRQKATSLPTLACLTVPLTTDSTQTNQHNHISYAAHRCSTASSPAPTAW